ncbi:hypothetical protein [Kitasatospora cineracea]|uniref:hypothetical protein n=1 Tax=Kitasatospora cineracea TaxID=88074 RepID=UPI0037F22393
MAKWAELKAAKDTVPGSVELVHREGPLSFFTWRKTGDVWCLGRTTENHTGMTEECIRAEGKRLRDEPSVAVEYYQIEGRWMTMFIADREELLALDCAGALLPVVPVGSQWITGGERKYYLVFSAGQLTGSPVLKVSRGGAEATERPRALQPVGSLPEQPCG